MFTRPISRLEEYSIPQETKRQNSKIDSTICFPPFTNHQKYEIKITCLRHQFLCKCKKNGVVYRDVTLVCSKALSLNFANLRNPYHLTFNPSSKTLIFSEYGLRGGMFEGNPNGMIGIINRNRDRLGIELNRNDEQLARNIRRRLPQMTYSVVNVRKDIVNKQRIITLSISRCETIQAYFSAFWFGIQQQHQTRYLHPSRLGLANQLVQHIIDAPGDRTDIERTYAAATDITLYIDEDLRSLDIDFELTRYVYCTYAIATAASSQITCTNIMIAVSTCWFSCFNVGLSEAFSGVCRGVGLSAWDFWRRISSPFG